MTFRTTTLVAVALIAASDGAFAQNGRPFRTLRAEVATLQMQVADVQTQVAEIEQQAALALEPVQAQLDALEAQVAAHGASLEQLRAYDTLVDARIAALGGTVLAIQAALTGVEAHAESLAQHRSLMDLWLAALEQQWREAEARLAASSTDIQRLIEADRALHEYAAGLRIDVEFARTTAVGAYAIADETQRRLADVRAELATKQNLIRSACPAGSSIRQVDAAGTVTCEFDDVGGAAAPVVVEPWSTFVTARSNSYNWAYAYCPSGSLSTGGGFAVTAPLYVFHNAPLAGLGWVIAASNPSAGEVTFQAVASCLRL